MCVSMCFSEKDTWYTTMCRMWPQFMPMPLNDEDSHPCSFSAIFSDPFAASFYSLTWSEVRSCDWSFQFVSFHCFHLCSIESVQIFSVSCIYIAQKVSNTGAQIVQLYIFPCKIAPQSLRHIDQNECLTIKMIKHLSLHNTCPLPIRAFCAFLFHFNLRVGCSGVSFQWSFNSCLKLSVSLLFFLMMFVQQPLVLQVLFGIEELSGVWSSNQ